MKAVYIVNPKQIEVRDIPMPEPREGEALLKVLNVGICGSDLGSYRGTFAYFDYPRIPGHEFSAEIVSVPKNDRGLRRGMLVTGNPYFNCNACFSCKRGLVNACMDNQTMGCQRDGAMCEYISMPIDRLCDGKGLSPEILALVEPFCIGYHGVKRAGVKQGDRVLVIGAGTIGVLAANAALSFGAEVYISDVMQSKLDYAQEHFSYAGTILNSSPEAMGRAVGDITGIYSFKNRAAETGGFDVVIEAVGLPSTFQASIDAAAYGGRVVLIGVSKRSLDFNFTVIQKKELNIYGSRNALTADFEELISRISSGQLRMDGIITDRYPYQKAPQAFAEFDSDGANMLKTIIQFPGASV